MIIKRAIPIDNYAVYIDGKYEYNTLNNEEWFLISHENYDQLHVKKDEDWYKLYPGEYRDGSHLMFFKIYLREFELNAYDELIRKEIFNFTTNSILIQDLLIPDVMNYLKQFV